LDKLSNTLFENREANSNEVWWEVNLLIHLFEALFGKSMMGTPAFAELAYCLPLYLGMWDSNMPN